MFTPWIPELCQSEGSGKPVRTIKPRGEGRMQPQSPALPSWICPWLYGLGLRHALHSWRGDSTAPPTPHLSGSTPAYSNLQYMLLLKSASTQKFWPVLSIIVPVLELSYEENTRNVRQHGNYLTKSRLSKEFY